MRGYLKSVDTKASRRAVWFFLREGCSVSNVGLGMAVANVISLRAFANGPGGGLDLQ